MLFFPSQVPSPLQTVAPSQHRLEGATALHHVTCAPFPPLLSTSPLRRITIAASSSWCKTEDHSHGLRQSGPPGQKVPVPAPAAPPVLEGTQPAPAGVAALQILAGSGSTAVSSHPACHTGQLPAVSTHTELSGLWLSFHICTLNASRLPALGRTFHVCSLLGRLLHDIMGFLSASLLQEVQHLQSAGNSNTVWVSITLQLCASAGLCKRRPASAQFQYANPLPASQAQRAVDLRDGGAAFPSTVFMFCIRSHSAHTCGTDCGPTA